LRRTTAALNQGDPGHTRVRFDQQEIWFSMERGNVMLCCNLGERERRFLVQEGGKVALSSRENLTVRNGGLVLPPDTVVILEN
jgi:maltooligosyltrehalose trehalohydrolase